MLDPGHLLLGVAHLAGDLVSPGDGGIGVVVQGLGALPAAGGGALGEGPTPREEIEHVGMDGEVDWGGRAAHVMSR